MFKVFHELNHKESRFVTAVLFWTMSDIRRGRRPKNTEELVVGNNPISSRTRSQASKVDCSADKIKSTATTKAKATTTKPKLVSNRQKQVSGHSLTKSGGVSKDSMATGNYRFHRVEVPMDTADDNPVPVPGSRGSPGNESAFLGNHSNSNADSATEEEICVICMCQLEHAKTLKCRHKFCTECIDQCFAKINPTCPVCGAVYGKITGNMPKGKMCKSIDNYSQLPGHSGCGTIVIQYDFPDGIQTDKHPHPGHHYYGTHRVAFLPNNAEGQKVLGLLERGFDNELLFTVGRSATTGLDDQVIWNDVHHKTRTHGGPTAFGYPDPTYLNRVQEELAAKGIV